MREERCEMGLTWRKGEESWHNSGAFLEARTGNASASEHLLLLFLLLLLRLQRWPCRKSKAKILAVAVAVAAGATLGGREAAFPRRDPNFPNRGLGSIRVNGSDMIRI